MGPSTPFSFHLPSSWLRFAVLGSIQRKKGFCSVSSPFKLWSSGRCKFCWLWLAWKLAEVHPQNVNPPKLFGYVWELAEVKSSSCFRAPPNCFVGPCTVSPASRPLLLLLVQGCQLGAAHRLLPRPPGQHHVDLVYSLQGAPAHHFALDLGILAHPGLLPIDILPRRHSEAEGDREQVETPQLELWTVVQVSLHCEYVCVDELLRGDVRPTSLVTIAARASTCWLNPTSSHDPSDRSWFMHPT